MNKQAMRRYKVESSNIDSVGHNFLTKNLEIEFKGGNVYRYKKVPRSVFKKMMEADSKGKFFWSNVRFDYPYKKHRTKDGDKVRDDWKTLERKEKRDMDRQEKVAMSNVAKSAIAGGAVGATGGAVRGAANTLLNERVPKKKKIKEALKAAAKQALVGGLAGAATGAVSPAMWDLLGGKEKKASFELDTMYKEAATKWKHMFENLSNADQEKIRKQIDNPYNFASGSDDRLKRIAKNTGARIIDNLDEELGGDGSRKSFTNKVQSYFSNYGTTVDGQGPVIIADKKMPSFATVVMGKKQKDRIRGAFGVHEGFESVSMKKKGVKSVDEILSRKGYGTHMGPEVIHRESAYAARLPEKDRKKLIKIRKKQKAYNYSNVQRALLNYTEDASPENLKTMWKETMKYQFSPSQYDDLRAHGVEYGKSPVVDKEKLKQHKIDVENGVLKRTPNKIINGIKAHPYATALGVAGVSAATAGGVALYKHHKKKSKEKRDSSKEGD